MIMGHMPAQKYKEARASEEHGMCIREMQGRWVMYLREGRETGPQFPLSAAAVPGL